MARPMSKAEWQAAMARWKVPVKYYSGWDTRGRPGDFSSINGIIIHHTGSDSQSDDYLKFLFVTGRPADGIPGPLCHVSTDMDGDLWVGAAGRANHAGRGSSAVLNEVMTESYKGYQSPELKPGADNTDGNAHFYGNEVRFDGGQPMTAKQWSAAVLWSAAICDHYGWSARSVIGHREWTTRKPDPGNTKMYEFRAAVNARLLAGPPAPKDWFDMATKEELRAVVDEVVDAKFKELYDVAKNGTAGIHHRDVMAAITNVPQDLLDEQIVDMQGTYDPASGQPRPTIAFSSHIAHMPTRVATVLEPPQEA